MLADLDRPIIEYQFTPWSRVVKLRLLSAGQFIKVMAAMSAADESDQAAKITAMAEVCSLGIVDPKAEAKEWADEVTVETLMHLGNKVLSASSDAVVGEAKKN